MAQVEIVTAEDDSLTSTSGPVNGIINYSVHAACRKAYDRWLEGIKAEMRLFPGFIEADVVDSPADAKHLIAVSVVLRFESSADLRGWETSSERSAWLRYQFAPKRTPFDPCQLIFRQTLSLSQPRIVLRRARDAGLFDERPTIHMQDSHSIISWDNPQLQPAAPPSPSPPAKWRLVCLTYVQVVAMVETWTLAGVSPSMDAVCIGPLFTLWIFIFVVVACIVYASSELLTSIPQVAKWLKRPATNLDVGERDPRAYRVLASNLLGCCNQGCALFNPPPPPPPPPELVARLDTSESRLEALRRHNDAMHKALMSAEQLLAVHQTTREGPQVDDAKRLSLDVMRKGKSVSERSLFQETSVRHESPSEPTPGVS